MTLLKLYTLIELGTFEISFVGAGKTSFFSQQQCAWFSTVTGDKNNGHWKSSMDGYAMEEDLQALLDQGSLTLSWRSLRPYLRPSYSQTIDKETPDPPPWALNWFRTQGSKTATLEEYCLQIGTTYWARVGVEEYALPPMGPSSEPSQGSNFILLISDQPFQDRNPTGSLVPPFHDWMY
jgi:hypothetical protein